MPNSPEPGRHHVHYSEDGAAAVWNSLLRCHDDLDSAKSYVRALTRLAGPAAASRRTWTITRCDGTCNRTEDGS